jgi:hypothetical protein
MKELYGEWATVVSESKYEKRPLWWGCSYLTRASGMSTLVQIEFAVPIAGTHAAFEINT